MIYRGQPIQPIDYWKGGIPSENDINPSLVKKSGAYAP